MILPVYIISLASATHRRAFQEAQAERLGFDAIWSLAVGIQDLSDEFFYQNAFQWQRALKKTEVACFMSHLRLWRTIAEGYCPAVVLEDDVILGGDWYADVQTLAQHAKADFICLEAWKKKTLGQTQQVENLTLQKLWLNSAGAAGYMLWPSGARRLVSRYERYGVALADAFINQTKGWSAWQLVPANVVQMNVAPEYGLQALPHSESLIAREIHASAIVPSRWVLYRMKWRRFKGECSKALVHLTKLLISKRGYVPFMNQPHS
jgi:glycosyl transferase family 25